jgi:hypothetical protein
VAETKPETAETADVLARLETLQATAGAMDVDGADKTEKTDRSPVTHQKGELPEFEHVTRLFGKSACDTFLLSRPPTVRDIDYLSKGAPTLLDCSSPSPHLKGQIPESSMLMEPESERLAVGPKLSYYGRLYMANSELTFDVDDDISSSCFYHANSYATVTSAPPLTYLEPGQVMGPGFSETEFGEDVHGATIASGATMTNIIGTGMPHVPVGSDHLIRSKDDADS